MQDPDPKLSEELDPDPKLSEKPDPDLKKILEDPPHSFKGKLSRQDRSISLLRYHSHIAEKSQKI